MTKRNWLKKYTKLSHLEDILENKRLFLNDPAKWDDRHDRILISKWRECRGFADVRATCVTAAQDRFHFWEMYGGREKGVCLWFDKEEFERGIDPNDNMKMRDVRYFDHKRTREDPIKKDEMPFLKRVQYADEKETRIVSWAENGEAKRYVEFPKTSLKRIYLNAWLSSHEIKCWTRLVQKNFPAICIKRNRVLEHSDWLRKVDAKLE